jgi:hypothetical protein
MVAMMMKFNPMATLLVETRNWFTSEPVLDLNMFLIYTAAFAVMRFRPDDLPHLHAHDH